MGSVIPVLVYVAFTFAPVFWLVKGVIWHPVNPLDIVLQTANVKRLVQAFVPLMQLR
mgnify:CR=1 FL=1